MNAKSVKAVTLVTLLLSIALGASRPAQGQAAKGTYPSMAPVDRYLNTDRDAEIALAKSAAPPELARDAEVLVLSKDGYHTAIQGKNGFTCLVERGWISPLESPDFWNPRLRGPICYNPAAVRTILPYTILRTKLILTGLSKAQMVENIQAMLGKNQLPMPEPGAISFMLSKDGYLGDGVDHWHPHLMFYLARTDPASWGANLTDSPVVFNSSFAEGP